MKSLKLGQISVLINNIFYCHILLPTICKGAIQMRRRAYEKAYNALLEAFKEKSTDWRIIENLISCCVNLHKFKECIQFLHKLVDLRFITNSSGASNDNDNIARTHHKEIKFLAMIAIQQQREQVENNKDSASSDNESKAPLVIAMNGLFEKLTSKLSSNPLLWEIIAEYRKELGQMKDSLDARTKQVLMRNLKSK